MEHYYQLRSKDQIRQNQLKIKMEHIVYMCEGGQGSGLWT